MWPAASSTVVAWPNSTAGQHGCLGKAAPLGALISRFVLHALALGSPRAVAELWSRFVGTLRQAYWEHRRPLPRMSLDCQQQQDDWQRSAATATLETDAADLLRESTGSCSTPEAPGMCYSLLHQKLQMLDLCVHLQQRQQGRWVEQGKEREEEQPAASEVEGWDGSSIADPDGKQLLCSHCRSSSDSSSYFSAAAGSDAHTSPDKSQKAQLQGPALLAHAAATNSPSCRTQPGSSSASLAVSESDQQPQCSDRIAPMVLEMHVAGEASLVMNATAAAERDHPEGVAGLLPDATLYFHPDRPLRVPVVHEPPPQTEDQVVQASNGVLSHLSLLPGDEDLNGIYMQCRRPRCIFENAARFPPLQSLAAVEQEAALGPQLQGRMLLSDMQAFKAANPGCCLLGACACCDEIPCDLVAGTNQHPLGA